MQFESVKDFLSRGRNALQKGPVALLLIEDDVAVDRTLAHLQRLGFRSIVAVAPAGIALPDDLPATVCRVTHDMLADDALTDVVNPIIAAAPDRWFFYGYNAEFLFYPFCEHRSVGELAAFCMEERRDTVLTYVVDLYAGDLQAAPDAVSHDNALLDKSGYYALARKDQNGNPADRQLDFHGGLRWRFEEHIPPARRRIDRVALFRAKPGLELKADHTFNDPEYNTYACPWHHSPSAALCSFRTAKALKRNPGSAFAIDSFHWRNSIDFKWSSQQLLDLGLMEPGQWF